MFGEARMTAELLEIGRVVRPHGVRGELLIDAGAAFETLLAEPLNLYFGKAAAPHALASARRHRGAWLIRLEGCLDRGQAEPFRGQVIYVRPSDLPSLPAGQHYPSQILGLEVETDEGSALGRVTEVIETGANDVYVVSGPERQILLPAIPDVILTIDLDARRMRVHLLEGL